MTKFRFRTSIWLVCLFCANLKAQQPDSLAPVQAAPLLIVEETPDTTKKPGFIKRIWTKDYPNPRTAVLLSLALPGAGQIYNKKWWKLPIVYGALGVLTYAEIDNIRQYRILRDNYKWIVDGDPNTNPTEAPYTLLDATSMRQYRDQWRRYVELTSAGLGLVYILAATEAFVDAHLARFDVGDDLSLRLRPSMQATPDSQIAFGVGLTLQIGR
ncbi:MAG: hypothetical protein IPM98_07310 [Lewinellaceae bacterium]|nr:hypothetical protein [Lewinellaceae bacterium]